MENATVTVRLADMTRRYRILRLVSGLAAASVVLAACAYQGAVDRPVTLKLTWFSYLNGDDMRQTCVPGSPESYRLVYNGNYNEQLRSYEVVGDGAGSGFYTARVMTGGGLDVTKFSISDPQAVAGWTATQAVLAPANMADLEATLDKSGAFAAAPNGLRIASEQFFWTSAACHQGVFYFNAWLNPSDRFARLVFPEVLLRYDRTEIAFNPPRVVVPADRQSGSVGGHKTEPRFNLRVGENGLDNSLRVF